MALPISKIKLIKQSADDLEKLSKERHPDNFSAFIPWKVRLADIICVPSFHRALIYLYRYDSSLAKKAEEKAEKLWQQTNAVTASSDYSLLGPVDMLRVSASDLAGTLRDIAQIERKERKRQIVKRTRNFIIFLAALLTCIYLLWWLWTNFLA